MAKAILQNVFSADPSTKAGREFVRKAERSLRAMRERTAIVDTIATAEEIQQAFADGETTRTEGRRTYQSEYAHNIALREAYLDGYNNCK